MEIENYSIEEEQLYMDTYEEEITEGSGAIQRYRLRQRPWYGRKKSISKEMPHGRNNRAF